MKYLNTKLLLGVLIGLSIVIISFVNISIKHHDLEEEREINTKIKSADEHLSLAVEHFKLATKYVASSQLLFNERSYEDAFKSCLLGTSSHSDAKRHYLDAVAEYNSALQKLQNLYDKKYDILHQIFVYAWSTEEEQNNIRKIQEQIKELEFEISMIVPRIEQNTKLEISCNHMLSMKVVNT